MLVWDCVCVRVCVCVCVRCTCIHVHIHTCTCVGGCLFPPSILQPRSWRGVADGGCESEFHSGLADN